MATLILQSVVCESSFVFIGIALVRGSRVVESETGRDDIAVSIVLLHSNGSSTRRRTFRGCRTLSSVNGRLRGFVDVADAGISQLIAIHPCHFERIGFNRQIHLANTQRMGGNGLTVGTCKRYVRWRGASPIARINASPSQALVMYIVALLN
jgi:hypothetical protein